MADVAVGAIVLVLVTAVIVLATRAYNRSVRGRFATARENERWHVAEHATGNPSVRLSSGIAVCCEHPRESPLIVGSVNWNDPDFEYKIEELRAQAQQKLAALNSHS